VKNRMQAGFTLVELIVVIVILGILAAVALPRFMGLEREARVAAVRSMAGTMLSAANMARGVCQAQGCANGAPGIPINGVNIVFQNGYPNNASIRALIQSTEGFNTNAAGNQMIKRGGANNNCFVQYNAAPANGQPTITYQGGAQITDQASENAVLANLRAAC